MIREPYGVVPYNTTIDTSISNTFSLIFNGDELESYKYDIFENNQGGSAIYSSARVDNPTIYNDDELSFKVGGDNLASLVGKNLLWRITFWENNASYKLTDYKDISRSTTESAPTIIYLQNENSLLGSIDWSKKEIIVNITIRNERRRVIGYNTSTHAVTVSEAFSVLPTYGSGYTDRYILYGNFPQTQNENNPTITATIPVLNGITTNPDVFEVPSTGDIILTGVIPVLENITDNRLQNEVVVNLDFGSGVIYRIKEYWQWDVQYDIEKTEIVEDVQHYKITVTKTTYHEGQSKTTVETIADVTDIAWYQEHDSDVGAYCVVDRKVSPEIEAGTSYSAYRNYYDTNFYFFKSRKEATVNIDNFPIEQADAFPSRYYNFLGSYQQKNNIPVKYHIWEVYDITKIKPVYRTEKQFNSNLSFSYDNFENYHTYKIKLIVVNQEGAMSEYLSPDLIISYKEIDFKTSGEAIYNSSSYSVDVVWPDNRLSIPVLVDGEDGEFTHFFDYVKEEKLNLRVPGITQYRYDNLSGADLIFDSTNFMLSTFIAINDPGPAPWSGEIITLSSNPRGNRLSVIKNKYKLQIVCSDETDGGSITYDFYKAKKIAENNFIDSRVPFSLLKVVPGQQQGVKQADGTYRPLTEDEKIGYAYEWMEQETDGSFGNITWKDSYFWTETSSDTNTMVYKLLVYPNRAELYPMLRWVGAVKAADGVQITLGNNRLLSNRTNKTLLMIGEESREIIDYDSTTGIAIIDSAFSSVKTGDKFLCYYENGENAENDNVYVCKFTRRNNIPFNQISIFGDVEYDYLTVFTRSYFTSNEIHDMLYYFFRPKWTDENQIDILINCTYDGSLSSKYYDGIESEINGYRIYRNTFYNEEDKDPFESILIAEVSATELESVNDNTSLKITDYSVRNRGIFSYSILPMTSTVIGARIESNKIKTNWYEWIFTSIGRVRDNIYRPIEQWVFKLNIEAGDVQHNVNKVFHQGLSKYPKLSVGRTNYITTSLTCLVSDFKYETIYKDNYLIPVVSGKIPYNTTDINNTKVYIQQTSIFEGINLEQKKAYLFINNQQRRITFYGTEGIGADSKFYIIIEEPFKYFLPNTQNPSTNNYVIYTDYLPEGENEYQVIKKRSIYFDDSIERINAWNKFISTDEPILVKDMKGNCYIGVVSDSREQTDIKIDDFPTTISLNITQIADVNSYLIFGV